MEEKLIEIKAPVSGIINKINIKESDHIAPSDVILLLEIMKMQNEILSENFGEVIEVNVTEGDLVEAGDVLLKIKETND
ncbi:MAG: acetyl-CoA carboxylase biotin carboxyl carrier protein subunit [Lactobacillaceae bacterium]|jgi:biotin carboxyl carrier protein|nr:acetyl-CoA carboxylase biotin carboxyl carrier protein subunit [Lactobacillaceae bacterium]